MKNTSLIKTKKFKINILASNSLFKFSEGKRVVVTGLGAVTPLGNDLNTTWSNLLQGKTGIKYLNKTNYINHLPKSHLFGAPVDKEYFKCNKKYRTLATDNLLTQITMSSFFESVEDSNLTALFESGKFNPYRVGVVTGTSAPSLNCIVDNTTKAIENKSFNHLDRMGMPKLLTNLLNFNISKIYSFLGPTMALSLSCVSGLNSIGEGMKLIKNDEVSNQNLLHILYLFYLFDY
jgi:3-oxoacyl-[acyl-carrier-protein] synthase II